LAVHNETGADTGTVSLGDGETPRAAVRTLLDGDTVALKRKKMIFVSGLIHVKRFAPDMNKLTSIPKYMGQR
jgi:hypothetical protein